MATRERPLSAPDPRSRSLRVHRFISLMLILGLMLQGVPAVFAEERVPHTPEGAYTPPPEGFAAPEGADSVESDGPGALSNVFAEALDIPPTMVSSVSFGTSDPNGYDVFTEAAAGFPRKEGDYLALSSGCTSLALTPNTAPNTSCALAGLNNSQGNDMVQMRLTLNVPPSAGSWYVDVKFLSEEFLEWIGSQYNDIFLLEQGESNFVIIGSNVTAPNNQAIYYDDEAFTVNSLGEGYRRGAPIDARPTAAQAVGTTYDAATPALYASGNIAPGTTSLTLIFTVMDLGDQIYDTTVFLDNFRFYSGSETDPPLDLAEECGDGIDDNLNGQIDEGCNSPPSASAGGPYSGREGSPIALHGSASDPDGNSLTASWSYTPGSGATPGATCSFAGEQTLNPTITCSDDGTYHVTLTVTDGQSNPVSSQTSVSVSNVAPTASFTAPSQINESSPILLQLSNPSDPSSADTAAGFSYAFDCGSGYGSASSSATASCATNDNGTRTVKARISDKDGGFTEYTAHVTIHNVAPNASFQAPTQVNEGDSISLGLTNPSDPSSADTAAGFSYAFDCGSGYGSASSTASATCSTNDNGTRTVRARISDKDGGFTEYTAPVTIHNVAPTASFAVSSPVDEGSPIQLTLTNPSDPSSVDRAAGFSYAFDCGSGYGSASSTASTTCATNDNGLRTVKARITDKDGGFTEYTATSTIRNVAPIATFTASSQVDEGDLIALSLTNPSDPSSADTAAGFSYAFDCGSGYGSASSTASTTCATNDNGVRTVKAKITDKDADFTEYTATSIIRNVAATATFTAQSPVDEGSPFSLTLTNPSDPSSVDTAAGFSYAFDCGSGYGSASSTASTTCATNDNGTRIVKARISDKDGGTTEYTASVRIDNVAPTATFTAQSPVDEGSPFSLTLTNASDPSNADTAAGFSYAFDCGSGYGSASSTASATCSTNDNEVRIIKAKISDKDGGTTEYTASVRIDNVAPTALFRFPAGVNEGDVIVLALSIPFDPSSADTAAGFSYAFDCGSGYGSASSTASATCSTNDNEVRTVKARISDKDGGTTEYTSHVTIHNVAPAVGPITAPVVPVRIGMAITASTPFSDPGTADTHAAVIDWGNATSSAGSVAYSPSSGTGTVQGSYTYTTPGVYTIEITVTDDDGGSGSAIYHYVVVYDPYGAFLTGSGTITSPAGAYTANPSLTGDAKFGFNAKYHSGGTIPDGKTDFEFNLGNLDFEGRTYEWLVIAGAKAQLKGSGTINNQGNYGFMLTVLDGALKGDGGATDTFRIRIWDKNNGNAIVYDNQMGADQNADPITIVKKGNIEIH